VARGHNFHGGLEELLNPPYLRAMKGLRDALDPPWLRRMTELRDPTGFASLANAMKPGFPADLREAPAWQAQRAVQDTLDIACGGRAMAQMRSMADALAAMRLPSKYDGLHVAMEQSIAASSLLLAQRPPAPTAVLASLGQRWGQCATLTWDSEDTTDAATLLDDVGSLDQRIDIDVQVVCSWCEAPVFSKGCELRLVGHQSGVIDVRVVPVCTECQRRSVQDPDYYNAMLRQELSPSGPQLRVIDGGGSSDGVPRGQLRLAAVEDDKDSCE
jgi:hypothetical protein